MKTITQTVRTVHRMALFLTATFVGYGAATFTFDVDADQVMPEISMAGTSMEVKWPNWFQGQGRVERADSLGGPWRSVGRGIPYRTQASRAQQFYRVRARPVTLHVPTSYDPQTPMPLVLALHFYMGEPSGRSGGQFLEEVFKLMPLSQSKGFLYAFPDGLLDSSQWQFWSANGDCCDFGNLGVNDVDFLERVIGMIRSVYNVDAKRIYLIGLSNGALMAYEFAAKRPDLIAGVVALAPPVTQNAFQTIPSQPVSIVQIHGTSDTSATYTAARVTLDFPIGPQVMDYTGALAAVGRWAQLNGCSNPVTEPEKTLDLVSRFSGPDTIVLRYERCPPGGAIELWTIPNMDHRFDDLTAEFREKAIQWLLQHPKP